MKTQVQKVALHLVHARWKLNNLKAADHEFYSEGELRRFLIKEGYKENLAKLENLLGEIVEAYQTETAQAQIGGENV